MNFSNSECEPGEPGSPGRTVAVLCVRADSIYRALQGVECYDERRDARNYAGPWPVVAHPPCAQWGRLKGLANDNAVEKSLGPMCVQRVRTWGGVLEHPAASSLWEAGSIPLPGDLDEWGFTLSIPQAWFGHRADKASWFYVCGLPPADLVPLPCPIFNGSRSIESMSRAEREATPPLLASWLVETARRCKPGRRPATWGECEIEASQVIEPQLGWKF